MVDATGLTTLAYAIFGAMLYALIWYAKAWVTTNPPEKFNWTKFIATLVVGAGVGVGFFLSGTVETQENVIDQIVTYGAVTAVVETVLKAILAKMNINYPGTQTTTTPTK